MDLEPIAILLKFGFLAVLYLTLIWIARSAIKDLRSGGPAPTETGLHEARGDIAPPEAYLEVVRGRGLEPGGRFDLFGGATIGRGGEADIVLDDDFASSLHARIAPRGGVFWVEDLGSTNGTLVNMERVNGEVPLSHGDRIRIGDTEFDAHVS